MAPSAQPPSTNIYWGTISSAVAQRLTTAALWQQISDFEAAQGINRPAGLFQAVSQMRSLAAQQRNIAGVLIGAAEEAPITAEMISQDINARPLDQQALSPLYVIRFEATVLTDEGESTQWLSVMQHGYLPATKGDVTSLVTETGIDLATGYGSVFTGLTGNISISAR